jgi:hypothetical protein
MTTGEIIDTQNTIISMQAKVINELFQLLGQHVDADELDALPTVEVINKVAMMSKKIGG